ncbi:MAG TPA: TIGR02285 family protein [Roseateles sp.]
MSAARWLSAWALALLAPATLAAPAVERITWLSGDTLVQRDGGRVQRPSDRMINWLSTRLRGVEHRRVVANAKRSWMLIQAGEQVCHASAVRLPERERLAYFSNTWLMPPVQLVMPQARRAQLPLDGAGHVDLAALLADPQWRGLLVDGRSYGPQIDAQLAQAEGSERLQRVTSGDFGSNILPMLLRGNADYAIEYPNVLAALARLQPEVADMVTLPIRGAAEPVPSGVACPRTPWGRAAVRLIDRALGTPEGAAMLREGLLQQLSPDTQRQYRSQLDGFFQRRSKPTPGL